MRPRPREIAGATLGLIGVGTIGREVARKASALGMRVVATREHPEKDKPEMSTKSFPIRGWMRCSGSPITLSSRLPSRQGHAGS